MQRERLPPTIQTFIKDEGGISPSYNRGQWAHELSMIREAGKGLQPGVLNHRATKTAEEMALACQQAGYIYEADVDEMLFALAKDVEAAMYGQTYNRVFGYSGEDVKQSLAYQHWIETTQEESPMDLTIPSGSVDRSKVLALREQYLNNQQQKKGADMSKQQAVKGNGNTQMFSTAEAVVLPVMEVEEVKPVYEDPRLAELERLREENARLKAQHSGGLSFKVSDKGGVSVYGMGKFPVTLYKEQWEKLLDKSEDIRAFIKAHEKELKTKPVK